ncbi:hypothetical protein AQJ67_39910 [Streptomyces caeruleatus]|uniref:Uncharacterized protein n=1 Tax=Streptomyces caeruleatus TaxID=661399 RepID=A0A117RIM4_9ACTN|nr:hypothetical protein AQJ67_39910 [Streptomyces caeruleatus]
MSRPDPRHQLGRLQDLELEAHQHHMDHHHVEASGAGAQQTAAGTVCLQLPVRRRDVLGGLLQGHQQPDDGMRGVRARGDAPGDVGGEVLGGRCARGEARAVRRPGGDAVDAERPPVLAVEVPGDQVPAALAAHQAVRLDTAAGGGALVIAVLEAQSLGVPAEVGELGQHGRVDGRGLGAAQHRHGEGVEGAHAAAQPVGQDLLQLGEGPYGGFADALDALARGRAQAYGDGDRLVVVQQQGWQLGAGPELVAAAGAGAGVDRVAEFAQAVDVAAHCAGGDAEAFGELSAGPFSVGLEEGEQSQEPGGGVQHDPSLPVA